MARVATTIENDGVVYPAEVMRIVGTELGYQDHGIFHAMLTCEGDTSGVGVGGYRLDTPNPEPGGSSVGSAYGMDFLLHVVRTAGVSTWESLVGTLVYVLLDQDTQSRAVGIANLTTGKVFDMAEHAAMWREKENDHVL